MAIHKKVTGSVLGAAVATIAVYAVEATFGIDIPSHVEDAVTIIGTFGAGYITKA